MARDLLLQLQTYPKHSTMRSGGDLTCGSRFQNRREKTLRDLPRVEVASLDSGLRLELHRFVARALPTLRLNNWSLPKPGDGF
jgi:hypothetical protein